MEPLNILRLNLLAPLRYVSAENIAPFPPGAIPPGEEWLFCFEVNPLEVRAIEPEVETYLGSLLCRGKSPPSPAPEGGPPGTEPEGTTKLPAGTYLFAQQRRLLAYEETLEMALEVQKEGLWERLIPGDRLYLRYLTEDNAFVTQVWRPCTPPETE